ncbi:MAG TPA: bacillithiol biosynthesis cysteine-adding enzyme BshC [Anaeromyxobacteraceae bacterium]|nr:bacillithiol biosynthesis cysteine-adding enzyme BshC [Anaeromyxobacteraceae bacterium]
MGAGFFASFIGRETAAGDLLPSWPFDEAAWDDAARRAGRRRASPELLAELGRQSAALPPSPARERNVLALGAQGASAVVTGQQVGLFLGPLYTLHKAATAVARARDLAARTGRPCVPIFWLQTEDHDFDEVAHAEVLAPAGRRTLGLPPEAAAERRVSLAHRRLPPEADSLVAALADLLEPLPHGAEVAALVSRHYRAGRSPGAAFAGVLAELFAEEGLVVLDPRTEAVARLAAPVVRRSVEEAAAIGEALVARGRELRARGFAEQVPARPDASLAFFHPRGPAGPRYRLSRTAEGFETPEGPVASSAVLERLERDPLSFSSSALLRPLVQDALLPTAAYVGGPAEIAYFAQLPPLYDLFGLEMPLVAPRARLRILEAPVRRELSRLELAPADVDRPREELVRRIAPRLDGLPPPEALRASMLGPIERELDRVAPVAARLDAGLERALRRTRRHVAKGVDRFLARLDRAALQADALAAARLERVLEALRPSGQPQERVYAFPPFAARAGPRVFVRALVEAAAPLGAGVRDVTP